MRLNLGAGVDVRQSYVNVDRVKNPGIDQVWDLDDMPWPWADESVKEILCLDVIEHLRCLLVPFMDEAWRVLNPDGFLHLRTGTPDHPQAWADPTHVRPYQEESFTFFTPGSFWFEHYGRCYTDRHWRMDVVEQPDPGLIEVLMYPIKDGGDDGQKENAG